MFCLLRKNIQVLVSSSPKTHAESLRADLCRVFGEDAWSYELRAGSKQINLKFLCCVSGLKR